MTSRVSTPVLIGGGLLAAVVVVVLVLSLSGGSQDNGYQVRAIFDNAVNVIPGEDVKIAGVKVGAIDSLDVVNNRDAAIVLNIDAKGFQDFRTDASCTINAQSLIGEKFVACNPTRARRGGSPAPPLPTIPAGQRGAGQHLLTISHTSSPVDPDLINNIMRYPGPQRLTVILNELGVAVGARGNDLRTAIRRADPALAQTDKVLSILASQNTTLADLATDSDAALAPLAGQRQHLTGAIRSIGATAQATATQRAALASSLQKFPAFLRQLVPTTDRLGELADAGTPLMKSLHTAAPGLNRFAVSLVPFANALGPYFASFGKTAAAGQKTIVEAKPAITALTSLATNAGPVVEKVGSFLGDLQYAGGIENFLDLIYNSASASNGFDDVSHFLRGTLIVTQCATYAIIADPSCNANFIDVSGDSSSRAASGAAQAGTRDAGLQRASMVLNGSTPAQALTAYPPAADADATTIPASAAASTNASGSANASGSTKASGAGADTGASSSTKTGSESALLNYLLAP